MNSTDTEPYFEHDQADSITHQIETTEFEVRKLLHRLPENIDFDVVQTNVGEPKIERTDDIWYNAVGGATLTPDKVRIDIDDRFTLEPKELLEQVNQTVTHELAHVDRQYTFETSTGLTLLEHALEEGLGTSFEKIIAGSEPWYGMYSDRDTMLATFQEVKNLGPEENKNWKEWKFFKPDSQGGRHWILYRVGTFIVEEALAMNPELSIVDLVAMTREEILDLSKLDVK